MATSSADRSTLYGSICPLLEKSQIRVLSLKPKRDPFDLWSDTNVDEIESFTLVDLADDADEYLHTEYEALSYTWGDQSQSQAVCINTCNIPITPSLHDILRALRLEYKTRNLWIDAICINQEDNEEKSSQIRLMARIYSKASRVLAWIGNEEAPLAAEHIGHVNRFWSHFGILRPIDHLVRLTKKDGIVLSEEGAVHSQGFNVTPKGQDFVCMHREPMEIYPLAELKSGARWYCEPDDSFVAAATSSPMLALYSSPWFSRVWIVQETVCARELVLCFGKQELEWSELASAVYLISLTDQNVLTSMKASETFQNVLDVVTLRFSRSILKLQSTRTSSPKESVNETNVPYQWSDKRTIARLVLSRRGGSLVYSGFRDGSYNEIAAILQAMRWRSCKDDRDRLYGALGIFPWDFGIRIEPDYSKSVAQVYVEWAKSVLKAKRIDVLNDAGLYCRREQTYPPMDNQSLPSWVPEYRKSELIVRDDLNWLRADANELWGYCIPQVKVSDHARFRHRLEIQVVPVGEVALGRVFGCRPLAMLPGFMFALAQVLIKSQGGGIAADCPVGDACAHVQDVVSSFASFCESIGGLGIKTISLDSVALSQEGETEHAGPSNEETETDTPSTRHFARIYNIRPRLRYEGDSDWATLSKHEAWSRYTFFLTDKGNVGFAPCHLSAHDIVIAIPGLPSPYIITRVTGSLDWRLRAPCYIQGMMQDYEFSDEYSWIHLV